MFSKLPYLSQTPVTIEYTPNSVLKSPHIPVPFQTINNRGRYSTCTDVSWFNNDQNLAVMNFAKESLYIYQFDAQKDTLTVKQTLTNNDGMQLSWPDKLAFSPDGLYLAITNILSRSINMYSINPHTKLINPVPIQIIKHPNSIFFHGIAFSTTSKYIVSTTIDHAGFILINKIEHDSNGALRLIPTQVVPNNYLPFKPKSINFSNDGSLMIICYSLNANSKESLDCYGAIAIYAFDNVSGTLSQQPVCELVGHSELCTPDDVTFSHDPLSSLIIAPTQGNDTIVFYTFDKKSNKIDPNFFTFTNPEAKISFPHGISLSSDNKYLALSNYGDDKVTIYSLI